MRSTILAMLASASLVCARGCNKNDLSERLAQLPCAAEKIGSITDCLPGGKFDVRDPKEYEKCLIAGGCPSELASGEGLWWILPCWTKDGGWELEGKEEVKKRQDDDEETTTKKETTIARPTIKTLTPLTSASTSAMRTTTSPSSMKATTTSTSEATTDSTIATTETLSPSTTLTSTPSAFSVLTTGTPTTPLICSLTTTKSTTQCSISAGRTINCLPTTVLLASCAPGMICFPERKGATSCMRRVNTLTTSGVVVAIAFAVGLTATAIAVLAMVVLGNKKARAIRQEQLLAAAGKGRSGERGRQMRGGDVALPLIPRCGGGQGGEYTQQGYFEQGERGGVGGLTRPETRSAAADASSVPRLELH